MLTRPRAAINVLSWGLAFLLVLMVMAAWSQVSTLMYPTTPGVAFVDMPPALIAANFLLLLVPLLALALPLLGVTLLRRAFPDARERLTWRLGGFELSPFIAAALLVLTSLLALAAGVALAAWAYLSGQPGPSAGLFLYTGFYALEVSVGWLLIIVSARGLGAFAEGREEVALRLASMVATAGAFATIAGAFVATAFLALGPTPPGDVVVPPPTPGVSVPATLAAAAAAAVLLAVSRRIARRRMATVPAVGPGPA